jgi:hypothetical protein
VLATDEPSSYADDPGKPGAPWLALPEPPACALGHRKLDSLPRTTVPTGAAGRSILPVATCMSRGSVRADVPSPALTASCS